jgi:DDE superfamily endonuclease
LSLVFDRVHLISNGEKVGPSLICAYIQIHTTNELSYLHTKRPNTTIAAKKPIAILSFFLLNNIFIQKWLCKKVIGLFIQQVILFQRKTSLDLLHNCLQTALWPVVPHQPVLSLLSYERLYKKPLLFKSFTTGITLKEFDNIYDKEITKRYDNHEIKRLSTKSKDRERKYGAGRSFKLDVKNRFLILLVYYRLYITYTLTGFLFDLDQSNVCRDIQKIEPLIRKCVPIPQMLYNITKRMKTPQEVEKYFLGFLAFIDSTE